jgi:hypothetical protein
MSIDRVARAIYEAAPRTKTWWPGIGEAILWDEMVYDWPPLTKEPYRELARAAIAVIAAMMVDQMYAALQPLADIPLWRDTHPRLDILAGERLPFTAEQVRKARALLEKT